MSPYVLYSFVKLFKFPARYRNETGEAEVYYKQALQLVPTNGTQIICFWWKKIVIACDIPEGIEIG
jgi:hypothetical protein